MPGGKATLKFNSWHHTRASCPTTFAILTSFRMDTRPSANDYRGKLTTCGYEEKSLSCPTFLIGHPSPSPSCPTFSIGHPSWSFSDGYPPQTAGMTEGEMDPCHRHAGMTEEEMGTCHRHAGMTKGRWIPADHWRR